MLGTLDRHPLMSLAGSPSSPSAEPGIVYALLALQADAGDNFCVGYIQHIYLCSYQQQVTCFHESSLSR